MINRYFEPTAFTDHGYMSFIALAEDKWALEFNKGIENILYVSLTSISFFNFPIFDLSRIHVLSIFGTDLNVYEVDASSFFY